MLIIFKSTFAFQSKLWKLTCQKFSLKLICNFLDLVPSCIVDIFLLRCSILLNWFTNYKKTCKKPYISFRRNRTWQKCLIFISNGIISKQSRNNGAGLIFTHQFLGQIMRFYNNLLFAFFFLTGIPSMQGWTATTRHAVTGKRKTKRLKHSGNIFLEWTYS